MFHSVEQIDNAVDYATESDQPQREADYRVRDLW